MKHQAVVSGAAACALALLAAAAQADPQANFRQRADIAHLPGPLKDRLALLFRRPSTFAPMRAFSEADDPSQLFQYYLIDTEGFEPNIFTAIIPGVNDHAIPTAANAANHQLPTLGAVRVVLEPKPGLPTDPNDPGAFIDMFTDISGLFVINNESGWYEGWMIHDVRVPDVAPPRADGNAQFGAVTAEDADALAGMGGGQNVAGNLFTLDGNAPRLPSADDRFPGQQSNLLPVQLSLGAYNCTQQSDCHSYWEFNEYTDWVYPLYEQPFTGGLPGTFDAGKLGALQSIVPGSGPHGIANDPVKYGDAPNLPRDPDRGPNASPDDPDRQTTNDDAQKETRLRFVPSALAQEILLDAYLRRASFEPHEHALRQRLFDAYAAEVARVDGNHGGTVDGVLTFVEADEEGTSDGGQSNERLYLPATKFNRIAVSREINDGLLAPRFAPSQRAWVMTGSVEHVDPSVPASIGRDGDDR
jgi:hypothetical protein